MTIRKQADFCSDLTARLVEAVKEHEAEYDRQVHKNHSAVAEWGNGITQAGASKTQIQNDIIRLRRELATLSRMFDN